MSKIKKITVSNLKAVAAMSADFNGCTAIITGGNNKGKTSFLRSLPDRLRGIKPEIVLKHSESDGSAELELTTGEKFIWSFDNKKEKLVFISEKNIPQSVTKDLCKFYFPPVFDVDEFLNSTPKKQKEILQKLTGIDFSEFDRAYKLAYDDRTFKNKRVEEEKARLVLVDPDLPAETTAIDQLENEYNGIEAHNLRYETVVTGIKNKNITIGENVARIATLQLEIEALQSKNISLQADIDNGNTWLTESKNKRKDNGGELLKEITKIKETNKEVEANNLAKKQRISFDNLVSEAKEADVQVKRIEAEKLDVIKNASMPEGFGFSEDGVTFEGYSFDKATLSTSKVYIGALKLAALNLGDVKTLHFDASFLDKNSLSDIEKWAEENELQLLIERPDFEGGDITYEIVSSEL